MKTKRFSSRWYVDCTTQKERDERRKLVENSNRLREVMVKILDKDFEIFNTPSSQVDMRDPSWPIQKAYREGYARALYDLKGIIE